MVIAFILSLYFSLFLPIRNLQPIYFDVAIDIQNNNYTEKFFAFGYPALISGYIMNNVEITMRVVHFLSLVLTWIITLYLCLNINLRDKIKNFKFYDINFIWIFFWFTFLFFHPYFHLNLIRVTDTGIITLFFAALYALILLKFKSSKILLVISGVLLGLLITIRPQAIALILFFFIFFYKIYVSKYQLIIFSLTSLLTYIIFAKFITGDFLFWPTLGPFNLYAGNNPFSYETIKNMYNSEYTIHSDSGEALAWCGFSTLEISQIKDSFRAGIWPVFNNEYINCTLKFIQNDFLGFVKTTIFKAYNLLFRPNLKSASETYSVIIQILIVIPAYIWWLLFVINSRFRKEFSVKWGALFIFIYCAPSILTNSDPRYSLPLAIIYIMSSMNFLFKENK